MSNPIQKPTSKYSEKKLRSILKYLKIYWSWSCRAAGKADTCGACIPQCAVAAQTIQFPAHAPRQTAGNGQVPGPLPQWAELDRSELQPDPARLLLGDPSACPSMLSNTHTHTQTLKQLQMKKALIPTSYFSESSIIPTPKLPRTFDERKMYRRSPALCLVDCFTIL